MSTSTETPARTRRFPRRRAKQGYHHGDLRQALVQAALALIERQGADAFTLREVARRVGVTHTAPYRHFADKDTLLAAVAEEGFDKLYAGMTAALGGSREPLERLQAIGIAYVQFAVAHPSHFQVMHQPELAHCATDEQDLTKQRPFELLLATVRECQDAGHIAAGPTEPHALSAWCIVHGLATLLVDGVLEKMPLGPGTPVDAARLVTGTLLSGLVIRK